MNTALILLYMSLTHYYHSDDDMGDKYNDFLYSISEDIAAESDQLVDSDIIANPLSEENTLETNTTDSIEINDDISLIKSEAEIFDLDETEFTIEDLTVKDEDDEVEITVSDLQPEEPEIKILEYVEEQKQEEKPAPPPKKKKQVSVIYTDMAGPTLEEAKKVLELVQIAKFMLKLKPKKKFPLSYSSVINPPIINQRAYKPSNQHLDPVQYHEEYFQMLFVAIDKKDLRSIQSLTSKFGVNRQIYVKGLTPLIYAINKGDINVVKKILALGYDPNQKDDVGNAPIHLAVLHGRVDILTELIKYNANLAIPNAIYKRPIALAIETGNYYMAELLAKAGAINMKTHKNFKEYINSKKQYIY